MEELDIYYILRRWKEEEDEASLLPTDSGIFLPNIDWDI